MERVLHFDSIEHVLALLESEVVADEIREIFRLDGIEYLWTKEGTLIPSIAAPFASPFLYRGQTKRYQPCLPGVFRNLSNAKTPWELSPAQRAQSFVDRVRLEEFVLALNSHPATAYAHEIGLLQSPHGLAQHYELCTDRIDLTQDHKVAAFFATNERVSDRWVPVEEGAGVMYRIHLMTFMRHVPELLECLGKQALPRPGEQKAYTLKLPMGVDFESFPVETFTFNQRPEHGKRINDLFNVGTDLFPPDVMSEVADEIRRERTLSSQVLRALLESPTDGAVEGLIKEGERFLQLNSDIRVTNRPPIALNEAQHERAAKSVEALRSTFLRSTGVLAVRRAAGP